MYCSVAQLDIKVTSTPEELLHNLIYCCLITVTVHYSHGVHCESPQSVIMTAIALEVILD